MKGSHASSRSQPGMTAVKTTAAAFASKATALSVSKATALSVSKATVAFASKAIVVFVSKGTVAFACAAALVLIPTHAWAQAPDQARQAAYSTDQAEAGAVVYRQSCAACHLPNLAGSFEAPELAGPNFRSTWGARSVSDLLELMRETMPPQATGSLAEGQYVALAAFILRENGVAPAQARLSLSSSGRVIGGAGAAGVTAAAGAAAGGVAPTVRLPVPGRLGT